MKEKIKEILIAVGMIVVICIALHFISKIWHVMKDVPSEPPAQVFTVYDTIHYYQPITRDSIIIKYVRARLPIVKSDVVFSDLETTGAGEPTGDTAIDLDSADVEIPITQKRYTDDYYTAFVSGYNASLDSLHINRALTTIVRTKTKRKHWGVSVGIQGGYGITAHGLSPYAGVGFTAGYNF